MYPHRPKAEAFDDAVDVVELSSCSNRSSTERTAPPRPAHVQLGDDLRFLDPARW